MKTLQYYISEGQNFLVNKKLNNRQDKYEYHPTTREELKDIIIDLLKIGKTDLNCIDVSKITDMFGLFSIVNKYVTVRNIDISKWDVSNVINMNCMFYKCKEFNSDLSKWDVSKVTDMYSMFNDCKEFNSDLSKWNVSNVTDIRFMFAGCKKFDYDLSYWNVSNVKKMYDTFYDCDILKKNNKIPKWYNI